MKLIAFATLFEADSTIKIFNAKRVNAHLFKFAKGWILLTGIGSYAAQQLVTVNLARLKKIQEVWNVGFAGALNDRFQVGDCISVQQIKKNIIPIEIENESPHMLPPLLYFPQGEASLLTIDFPLHNKLQRDTLKKEWDLVDMEGYGVAYASHFFEIPCRIWKIVSDFASENGRQLIQNNGQTLSQHIADHISDLIAK